MKITFILILFLAVVAAGEDAQESTFDLYNKTQEAWKNGNRELFLQFSGQLAARVPGNSGAIFQYARALAANGKGSEALSVLERIARMGGAPPAASDEAFASLRSNPEFRSVLERFAVNSRNTGFSEVVGVIPGKDLIAEGIAYDPVEKKHYVGSTYRRKIVEIDSGGVARDFASEKQDGLWGMVGMEVDPSRRHLWANTANGGALVPMIDPEPVSEGKTAIFKYALTTRKLIRKYETGTKESPRFFNDVAIAPNGDVYISETNTGEIYRITAQHDKLELFVAGGTMDFANGLAVSEDGRFLYVSHVGGTTVVNLSTGEHQLLTGPPDTQLGNFDGLVYYRNSLVGVQVLTGGVNRIMRLRLSADGTRVDNMDVLQVNHPLFVLPTTGDMVGDEFHYIANSQLRSFDEKGVIFPPEKLRDTVILKVDLLESEKEELLRVHEAGQEAHRKADAVMLLADAPQDFVTVSSGKIHRVTRDQERTMFETYLKGAVYEEYRDVEPPVVYVAPGGRSGWVISRTRAKRTQEGKTQEFVYAGIMTYEKRDGMWIRVANVSTFE